MEKSFDFGRLLKNHEKKHKSKPAQFTSVASGVTKRLESRQKSRKSTRLTIFDSIRNLSRSSSPVKPKVSEAEQKVEHRRQQLEKWKEEKEKKKKEAASQKKKPFVAGVAHVPLKFTAPPAPVKPSTSGRVTRSQSARNSKQNKEKQSLTLSFAPKNASFKPPQLKNVPRIPFVSLEPFKLPKGKITFTFDPIVPKKQNNDVKETKQTRTRNQNKTVEAKVPQKNTKAKTVPTKTIFKVNAKAFQSSSSSETDSIKSPIRNRRPLPTPQSPTYQSTSTEESSDPSPPVPDKMLKQIQSRTRKSLPACDSPILVSKTPRKSTSATPKQFTPKNQVPKSESSSEEKLRSPKSPIDVPLTPEQIVEEAKRISPCVTMSRGKDNARREMKKKLDEGLLDEDASDIDNIDHFRRQLASEIKRMTEMCETWERILEQTALPDSIQECVLSAVGQSRLLMSQKLQQFASLVERSARPEPGAALVTPADLHGFWDMVFMQIENVDIRFKKLEELRARNWIEEQVAVVAKKKPVRVAKAKPAAGPSRLKDMIAAARKAKKEQAAAAEAEPVEEKAFEAGFFCVRSPLRTPPAPRTPRAKDTLLRAVLSSEANKSASKNSASFAMLRASVMGKNVDCDGIALLPQTPLPSPAATPGRSILKQASTKKSSKKSIKVVLFNQSDDELNTSSDKQPMAEIESGIQPLDSGLSSIDVEEKENTRRKSHRLVRQDATDDRSPVMTRSRRKSTATPDTKTRTPRKSKILEEVEANAISEQTPKRSSRRRKDIVNQEVFA